MPLYEYLCDDCGRQFELIRKFSDPPVEKCPTCGGTVRKLMSSPAFQFKGSGWYITDYAKKDSVGAKSGDSGDSAKSEKSGETKSESKSESKSETKSETKADAKPSAKA